MQRNCAKYQEKIKFVSKYTAVWIIDQTSYSQLDCESKACNFIPCCKYVGRKIQLILQQRQVHKCWELHIALLIDNAKILFSWCLSLIGKHRKSEYSWDQYRSSQQKLKKDTRHFSEEESYCLWLKALARAQDKVVQFWICTRFLELYHFREVISQLPKTVLKIQRLI